MVLNVYKSPLFRVFFFLVHTAWIDFTKKKKKKKKTDAKTNVRIV